MSRRVFAIVVAIAFATVGTVGGLILVLTAESRAQNRISNPVTVAVAAVDIPVGTSGAQIRTAQMVRMVKMPKDSVPDDVMDAISPELDAMVVTSNIATGQLLLRAQFGAHAAVTGGLELPPGKMAVTVETGAPQAGYVRPGSQVVIFVTYPVIQPNGTNTNIERTRVLLPRVDVLAVGSGAQAKATDANANSGKLMLTVAVTQDDAERLIEAQSHGTLYLGLLSDSLQVTTGSGVDNTDRGGGTSLFP
jgi:pilus assembly protein CpaB